MKRRQFAMASGGVFASLNMIPRTKSVFGAEFEIGQVEEVRPSKVSVVNVHFSKLKIFPRYLDTNSDLKISTELQVDGMEPSTKKAKIMSFRNGETIDSSKIINRTGIDVSNIQETGIDTDSDFINCEVRLSVGHSDFSKTYKRSFTISKDNVVFADDFTGSNGATLGSNYLISQGVRKTRNTDTNTFTFQEDGNSNMEMTQSGSGGNLFGEIVLDISGLSNNTWTINLYGQSWSYNSEENNYRMGVIDRTDRSNFCEFMETEGSGVNPRVASNNVNSSYRSNDVSFSGGSSYNWSFQMNNGTITVYKDGSEVFSEDGFPSGEYTWFVMNENDGDTAKGETHLLDEIEVLQ